MPTLYPPKPSRTETRELARQAAEERRAERRRRERIYEIEFFRGGREDADELLGERRPAFAQLGAPSDPRLARAIEAAAKGWFVERYT